MDNRVKITNIESLRSEKKRLRLLAREQEGYLADQYDLLREKISAPVRFFNTVVSYIPGANAIQALFSAKAGKNTSLVGKIANIIVPLVANRFLPRKSGVVTRGIFSLLAKQVTALLTSGKMSEFIAQLTNALQSPGRKKPGPVTVTKRRGRPKEEDYGIPPDSETY